MYGRPCESALIDVELMRLLPCGMIAAYSLVDATYAPFHARLARYEGVAIPDNVLAWLQRIAARPAYVRTGGLGSPSV